MIKFYNNFIKKQIITLWKILQHFFVLINFSKIIKSKKIKIFYAGAISGNYGGSFVKIKRIKEFYPKSYLSFNLVYILSNAIFVIPQSISYLKKIKYQ